MTQSDTTSAEATTQQTSTPRKVYPDSEKLADIMFVVTTELQNAMLAHGRMINLHEALGVVQEEFDEWKAEVYKNPRKHPDRNDLARKELIQLAAMAIRALHDVV